MKQIVLNLSFDGTNYNGFQIQPNKSTIQGELTTATNRLFNNNFKIVGCSRTDSGVHAKNYFASISIENKIVSDIPEENIPRALNSILPKDIVINQAKYIDNDFHVRYCALKKEYVYLIDTSVNSSPFNKNYVWHKYIQKIDLDKMKKTASFLIGEHDFSSFCASGSSVVNKIREIYYIDISEISEHIISFKISGNGFLYNMVRIIIGTIMDFQTKNIPPEYILEILNSKDRSLAGITAPPQGLYLNNITYDSNYNIENFRGCFL